MKTQNNFLNFLVAQTISIVATLLLILVFALSIKLFEMPDTCITPINYLIKAICISLGVWFLTKDKTSGLKKGFLHGALYITIAFIVFSILNKTFILSLSLLIEILLGALVGGIIGILLVNIRKK